MVIEQLDDLRDDVMKPESVSLQFDQQSLESRLVALHVLIVMTLLPEPQHLKQFPICTVTLLCTGKISRGRLDRAISLFSSTSENEKECTLQTLHRRIPH